MPPPSTSRGHWTTPLGREPRWGWSGAWEDHVCAPEAPCSRGWLGRFLQGVMGGFQPSERDEHGVLAAGLRETAAPPRHPRWRRDIRPTLGTEKRLLGLLGPALIANTEGPLFPQQDKDPALPHALCPPVRPSARPLQQPPVLGAGLGSTRRAGNGLHLDWPSFQPQGHRATCPLACEVCILCLSLARWGQGGGLE